MDAFVDYSSGFHVQLQSRTADCVPFFYLFLFTKRRRIYVCAISVVTETHSVSSPLFHLLRNASIYSVRLFSLLSYDIQASEALCHKRGLSHRLQVITHKQIYLTILHYTIKQLMKRH